MAKTQKRPLTSWNLFVKKVKNDNPGKTFKEILVMASKLKKQGKMSNETMSNKKMKVKKTRMKK
jgi:hypothetical protein